MARRTRKKPLSLTNCPIALAADMIGDRWTLLILRELFHGATRFGEFAEILGAARNLLVERLNRLVDNGLVERFPLEEAPGRDGYGLTPMGEGTFPIVAALLQWGNDWLCPGGAPVELRERAAGEAVVVAVLPRSERPGSLAADDIEMAAGPGARRGTRERMVFVEQRRRQTLRGYAKASGD